MFFLPYHNEHGSRPLLYGRLPRARDKPRKHLFGHGAAGHLIVAAVQPRPDLADFAGSEILTFDRSGSLRLITGQLYLVGGSLRLGGDFRMCLRSFVLMYPSST